MKQLIEIVKQQMSLIITCVIFLVIMFWMGYSIDKMQTENKRLKIKILTKFTIGESMVIWSEGYKRAYDRIDKIEYPVHFDNDKFKIDSLLMLRKLEETYKLIDICNQK
jgi:uncharacterized phage-like protein YoqJ